MAYNGPFPQTVPEGGTGAATLTGVLIGNGTSAVTGNTVTQYDVLIGGASNAISSVGPGSSGQVLQSAGNASNPAYSTATYPATTTINQLLYSSSANTVAGLATANNGVLTTGATGIPVVTALASNGQIIIGSGAGAPIAATISAGTGISVTNGANTITIAATGSEIVWTDEAVSFNAASGNSYFISANAVTATLPSTPSQGDVISFSVDAVTTNFTITGNTGQKIRIGTALSAAAGTAVNNARGDSVTLVYRSSGTTWIASSVIGTWVVT